MTTEKKPPPGLSMSSASAYFLGHGAARSTRICKRTSCSHVLKGPNGPPMPPPIPPPKNRLNISSGEISSSHIGPCRAAPPGLRAKPLKGDDADADPGPNRLSGSPPKLSYLDFLSGSERIWKARDTTIHFMIHPISSSAPFVQVVPVDPSNKFRSS